MKKSRVWQAIVPGTQAKPQDTLRIRKTPWHGVTKQPPAVPLPPNATPERNKKSRFWQEFHCCGTELHCSRHRNLCTEHQRHFELGSRQAIPLLQGHRNLCTEHQKHFGVGFLDKEAVAHLMATIDTTEHTISGRAPPCCTTGSADMTEQQRTGG